MKDLICIVGRSCCGKDTLAKRIMEEYGIPAVCSYTTRPKRDYEIDGFEHYFITKEEMSDIVNEGKAFAYTINDETGIEYCATEDCIPSDEAVYIINPDGIDYLIEHVAENDINLFIVDLWSDDDVLYERAKNRSDDIEVFKRRLKSETEEFKRFHNSNIASVSIDANKSKDEIWKDFSTAYLSSKVPTLHSLCFKGVNYVFVDFDDTACLHTWLKMHPTAQTAWRDAMVRKDPNWYTKDFYSVNHTLKALLENFAEMGKDIICLTWAEDTCNSVSKKAFLDKEYPDMFTDYISTSNRHAKLDLVKKYVEVYGLSKEEVLIIDDHPDTLNDMHRAGYFAISPVAVQEWYFAMHSKGTAI